MNKMDISSDSEIPKSNNLTPNENRFFTTVERNAQRDIQKHFHCKNFKP